MAKILQKFSKVKTSINAQQEVLKSILKGTDMEVYRMQSDLESKAIKALI